MDIYQVDEEFEEDKYTVTGKTATDVVLPNIREAARGAAANKRQLPSQSFQRSIVAGKMGNVNLMQTPTQTLIKQSTVMSNRDSTLAKNFAFN